MQPALSAEAQLEQLFRDHAGEDVTDSLRDAICQYVDVRRATGDQVERIIIELKRVARRGLDHSDGRVPLRDVSTQDGIIRQTVTHCIAHYYRDQAR